MKICMISQHPPFDIRSYYKIKKVFIKLGHEVWYINWVKRPSEENLVKPPVKDIINHNLEDNSYTIKILSEIGPPHHPFFLRAMQSLKAFKLLYHKVQEIHPDILYINNPLLLPLGLYCQKKLGLAVIYDVYEDSYGFGLHRLIISFIEKRLAKLTDCLFTTTEGLRNKFRTFHKNIYVVYNSVDITRIPSNQIKIQRESLGINKDAIVVGYTGMLSSIRGIDKAIEALKYLEDTNIHLLIVGGPESELKKANNLATKYSVESRVHLLDSVSFDEIWKYYKIMDIGLILYQPAPNHVRTLPNKLFDYITMGIPIIASEIPEYKRAFPVSKKAIMFVDATNPIEIAKKIELLSKSPDIRLELSKNAKQIFNKKHRWEIMEKNIAKALNSIEK